MSIPFHRLAIAFVAAGCILGCETYRIERHHRPSFYNKASMAELPDQITLDDGTVVVYENRVAPPPSADRAAQEGSAFLAREEYEDGSITLRARGPEHVLANVFACLQNAEYGLLWDQLLSDRTKASYEARGEGVKDFARFFARHRRELAQTVNRMLLGLPREEVRVEKQGDYTALTLRPQVAAPFKYKRVIVVKEGPGLKLVVIE